MINVYHNLVPKVMDCIKALSVKDEKKACDIMELLDEMVEYAVTAIVPYTVPAVHMCLELATTKDMSDTVKVKAIGFIGWLTRSKTKVS